MKTNETATCWWCGKGASGAIGFAGGATVESMPKGGDIVVCAYCSMPGVYTDELLIREPTDAERLEFDDIRDVQQLRRLLTMARDRGIV